MIDILLTGYPGKLSRGWLGWSTVVLVHTSAGPVLFDTGAHNDRPALMQALADRGIAPAALHAVVLSHLHFDHIANVECFPQARILVPQRELDETKRNGLADPALPLMLIDGMLATGRVEAVAGEPELFPGVRLLLTPGHTLGHASLWLPELRTILAQDAVKHRGEIEGGGPATAISPTDARASVARIVGMADHVVPGHDVPLRIVGGKAFAEGRPRETVASNLDGRIAELEA